MTETVSMSVKKLLLSTKMKNLILTAKANALITACILMLSGMGLYEMAATQPIADRSNNIQDDFTLDINERSDRVYNSVTEVINHQGEIGTIGYKQTCENSISFIRKERLDTNHNYNMLSPSHKELVDEYRAYLKEAANVVVVAYSGAQPNLTKLNDLKNELI